MGHGTLWKVTESHAIWKVQKNMNLLSFSVNADPNAVADKVNAVKKYIIDITKVAEVSKQT